MAMGATMSITNAIAQVQVIPASQPHYTDDLLVAGVLVCGFVLALVLSDRKNFFPRLLKNFFLPRENAVDSVRTTNVVHMRMGLFFVAFASVGLLLMIYASEMSLQMVNKGALWLAASGAVVLLYLLKMLLLVITDRIFFDKAIQKAWECSYSNWMVLSAIPLYLLTVVVVFFDLAPSTVFWLLGICVVFLEFCLLYKALHIFLTKKYGFLQIFLYLCALELMPLLVVGKALVLFV